MIRGGSLICDSDISWAADNGTREIAVETLMMPESRQWHAAKARLARVIDGRIALTGTEALLRRNEDCINNGINSELTIRSLKLCINPGPII